MQTAAVSAVDIEVEIGTLSGESPYVASGKAIFACQSYENLTLLVHMNSSGPLP
jgi:hypothetical protein